jgi:hypothetical protein
MNNIFDVSKLSCEQLQALQNKASEEVNSRLEQIDLSKFSLEEIQSLQANLLQEISNRLQIKHFKEPTPRILEYRYICPSCGEPSRHAEGMCDGCFRMFA